MRYSNNSNTLSLGGYASNQAANATKSTKMNGSKMGHVKETRRGRGGEGREGKGRGGEGESGSGRIGGLLTKKRDRSQRHHLIATIANVHDEGGLVYPLIPILTDISFLPSEKQVSNLPELP